MSSWPDAAMLDGISDHQREQYEIATQGRVGFLSGGPGTGKTRTTASLIKAIQKQHEFLDDLIGEDHDPFETNPECASIAICCPTGKAATRSTEFLREQGINLQATTIHRMLEVNRVGYDGEGWEFFYDENNYLPYNYIITDEPSMIDTDLMASMLRAIKPGTHVLMAGDPYQLPPVGHGRPFEDMIRAGLPHGHLTQIWRFAGRIAHVCDAIKNGRVWTSSPKIDIDAPSPENMRQIDSYTPTANIQNTLEMVERLMGNTPGHHLLRNLNAIRDIQVLAPIREKSQVSVKILNKILQEQINPLAGRKEHFGFRVGDKVMCTLNQWCEAAPDELIRPLVMFRNRKARNTGTENNHIKQFYISNGDIGEVLDASSNRLLIQFTDRKVLFKPPFEKLELAYAITGHKSQGSQWPVTISLIDDSGAGGRVCNRSYWYTVLSRASRLCITVGKEHVLRAHCRQIPLERRTTFLRSGIESWLGNSSPQSLLSASSP